MIQGKVMRHSLLVPGIDALTFMHLINMTSHRRINNMSFLNVFIVLYDAHEEIFQTQQETYK